MLLLYVSGKVKITNAEPKHLKSLLEKLKQCGCKIKIENNSISLKAPMALKAINIETQPYPGFPTDLQSIIVATLIKANGISNVTENIFENRFKYVKELNKMGAFIEQKDKKLKIVGVNKLNGASVEAMDLRGGAALIIAALQVGEKTEIKNIEYILRGYEGIDNKLRTLGASIITREGG